MSANKYGNTLTVILVIIVIAVIVGAGVLLYTYVIKPHNKEKEAAQAIIEFDKTIEKDNNNQQDNNNEEINLDDFANTIDQSKSSGTTGSKKVYYQNFAMLGYITIPKTGVKLPILEETTPKALETSVAILYPSNAQLNEPGNIVIIGHNYRNGKLFSNNKKLSAGDKVIIKDTTGRELTSPIYQKFEAESNDASFYNRNTNGVPEITLSTCTDNGKKRTIIFAKAE